ncbi:nuclear transport factor 2 family protein [Sphingomonas sp. VDB2]|uniref:nuclear transport factor 2 family protein n=1 Tax=Sphingomonas sp. VDB2 TaxID=3228751 RepID=UPI003A810EA1|nr:nuclear transport factor 2 family protein [Sphingobium sp.]
MNDAAIAIPNLLYLYAELIDAADFIGAARLFRHGAVITGGQRVEGEKAIADMWRSWMRLYDGKPRTRHIITNPIILLSDDGQSATSRSQWTVLQATEDYPLQPVATGRYHDSFQRIDGQWCFAERNYAQVDLAGDLSAHLLKSLKDA